MPHLRLAGLITAGTTLLLAQEAPSPTLKWRGALWGSYAASPSQTAGDSLFLRPVEGGNHQITLDGLQLGADLSLSGGWSFRTTVLGGRLGKLMNEGNGDSGSLALPEAHLVWTGEKDILRIGRMNTFLGMEYTDGTQNLTASRGLLFNFAVPFMQVGLNWHHSFSATWSSDLWVFNGEDRVQDNNRSKTLGIGLNYNHGGAADKFASLGLYRGAEQASVGADASPGAEGRHRDRAFFNGQWAWGTLTLQWEVEYAREPFPAEVMGGRPEDPEVVSEWGGFGLIAKVQLSKRWAAFGRVEHFEDTTGLRLSFDPSIAGLLQEGRKGGRGLDLRAQSLALGLERSWDRCFSRVELRLDRLNRVLAHVGSLQQSGSFTWSFGASF